jgi:serine/threonine-protein kinase
VITQLASALEVAHARGIVHGDVKPGNLLLRSPLAGDTLANDELVLCDFGIARLADDGQPLSAQLGTLAYMAPEQRRGELSPAADLYSTGLVLRELLVGAAEFDRAALLRAETRDASLPPTVTARIGPRASDVTRLLATLLSTDPQARPTAAALVRTARTLEESVI